MLQLPTPWRSGGWICGMLHAFQHRDKSFDRGFLTHVLREAALL